jgi:Zn-dependent protease with chaperone function
MILQDLLSSYFLRLACFSLASFFLINFAFSVLTLPAARRSVHFAERLRPHLAARFMLFLRLLPSTLAFLAVAGLCVPSYLWLEPKNAHEQVDFWCWCAALLCVFGLGISITRVFRALHAILRCTRDCRREGRETLVQGESLPLLVIDSNLPLVAVVGVTRLRTIISSSVLRELSAEQLEAALAHERAHMGSRDNLKRLVLLLALDVFPFWRGFTSIDHAWAKFAEWAADDRAVAGDPARAVSLASALIRVARMGLPERHTGIAICFVADSRDLSARIDRLLNDDALEVRPGLRSGALLAAAALAVGMLTAAMMQPFTLYSVHRLLEHLVR